MTAYVEDSPRPFQVGWITDAAAAGYAAGAVISPWASPYRHRGGSGNKPGLGPRSQEFRSAGIPYWFDPATHVLQMTGVGDLRYYSEYPLWGGPVGDLSQAAYRDEHVRRVYRLQDEIGAPHLAPTPLLPSGLNNLSAIALDTARFAVERDPAATLTIAGTGSFWSDGTDLDAHVGALAALTPGGWLISFVQPDNDPPPSVTPNEVFGRCRTVRALSEYSPVHISHGDFAALPAVAAGATSVGSGWDKRQRVMAYADYAARTTGNGIASWYERPTVAGLLGTLSKRDGQLLGQQDPALAARLGGLPAAPGPRASFLHHISAVSGAVLAVASGRSYEDRFRILDGMYSNARAGWAAVSSSSGIRDRSAEWIDPLQEGLRMYARSEGWRF